MDPTNDQKTVTQAAELLRTNRVIVAPETFTLISLSHAHFSRLLLNAELSPRGSAPYFILSDKYEVTLMLDETDFATVRHAVRDGKTERGFRLLTFETELDFGVTGFLALVSRILAEADIPMIAVSAFSRDHVLVKQNDLAAGLKALSPHVAELC